MNELFESSYLSIMSEENDRLRKENERLNKECDTYLKIATKRGKTLENIEKVLKESNVYPASNGKLYLEDGKKIIEYIDSCKGEKYIV